MALLEEIRKQPVHVRELLFGLSTLLTVLVVGLVWLSSFQRDVYALLNPSPEDQQQFAAQAQQALPLRAAIGTFMSTLRASIYNLLDLEGVKKQIDAPRKESSGIHTLPTAETRTNLRPTPGR